MCNGNQCCPLDDDDLARWVDEISKSEELFTEFWDDVIIEQDKEEDSDEEDL